MAEQKRVRLLDAQVARKIAAGEVIDRPNAIVRELMDNAVDSGADRISVEITSGGIEKIRVADNGCGMSEEDLRTCAHPHATSKISQETDLLHLTTLGFRGEALSSMAAVSRLEISSGGFKMRSSVTEDHVLTPCAPTPGTIVQTQGLFENFPARRQFLKRPASEGILCRNTFEEKVLPRPEIAFSFSSDGEEKLSLPSGQTLKERFIQTMQYFEGEELFHQIDAKSQSDGFSFSLIIGEPSVTRSTRKDIFIYVNGRRIQEYSLVQAIVYGTQGYFPNGTFPVACIFIQMDPSLVDFNIHPAKREVRFKDIGPLHHSVSSSTRNFFRDYTVNTMVAEAAVEEDSRAASLFQTLPSGGDPFSESSSDFRETHEKNEPALSTGVSYSSVKRKDLRASFFSGSAPGESKSRFSSSPLSYAESAVRQLSEPPKINYVPETSSETGTRYEDGFHFVGSALGTFLIAEKNGTLYIIDQHAAHERIIYNRIMSECGQKQELLVPYTIRTDSAADDNFIEAMQTKLEECGFTCRKAGEGLWEFTTVPIRWKGTEADLKKDVLDRRVSPKDMINATAASTACRSAVMDGTVLDSDTASAIAREALELPDPHCPHGRPVFTTITRKQLFALVQRT